MSARAPEPRAPEPLAVLDDVRPYRWYTALARVVDLPDGLRYVQVLRFSAMDTTRGTHRFGLVFNDEFCADARRVPLVRRTCPSQGWNVTWSSGLGHIELPAKAQWLGVNVVPTEEALREAIARYDAGAASPSPASFLPADAPMVPAGYVPRVTFHASFNGQTARLPIVLAEAVFGAGATAACRLPRGGPRLQVTLTPTAQRKATPGRSSAEYRGTMTVRLGYETGAVVERAYPVSGHIELEGDVAIAPVGLDIPGMSCPSPACSARTIGDVRVDSLASFDERNDRPIDGEVCPGM